MKKLLLGLICTVGLFGCGGSAIPLGLLSTRNNINIETEKDVRQLDQIQVKSSYVPESGGCARTSASVKVDVTGNVAGEGGYLYILLSGDGSRVSYVRFNLDNSSSFDSSTVVSNTKVYVDEKVGVIVFDGLELNEILYTGSQYSSSSDLPVKKISGVIRFEIKTDEDLAAALLPAYPC